MAHPLQRGADMTPPPLDPGALIDQFTWQFFATLGVALVVGALGGLVPGRAPLKTDPPPPGGGTRDLVWWQRTVVGAVAAAAILFVVDVSTPVQLVCGSLVAGYAGTAVLAGLEARLVAILAQRDNAAMRRQINELNDDAKALVRHFQSLTPPAAVASPATATVAAEIDAIRKRREWL
jgi:hypothetical protein